MYHTLFEFGIWKSIFKSNLKEFCYKIKSIDTGIRKSNVNGWQSIDLDKKQDYLKPLVSHIEQQTNLFASKYYTNKFTLSHIWININPTGGYNRLHSHPGGMYSGVYYVSTPENCGNIIFERPDMEIIQSYDWKYNKIDYSSLNSYEWWMPSKEHTCYIFPSYMRHYVEPNRSQSDRISISFNLA